MAFALLQLVVESSIITDSIILGLLCLGSLFLTVLVLWYLTLGSVARKFADIINRLLNVGKELPKDSRR